MFPPTARGPSPRSHLRRGGQVPGSDTPTPVRHGVVRLPGEWCKSRGLLPLGRCVATRVVLKAQTNAPGTGGASGPAPGGGRPSLHTGAQDLSPGPTAPTANPDRTRQLSTALTAKTRQHDSKHDSSPTAARHQNPPYHARPLSCDVRRVTVSSRARLRSHNSGRLWSQVRILGVLSM